MNDHRKRNRKFTSAGEATAETDVKAPTTDDELNAALEDTFPASDPINFAGSSVGRSPENAENPPVGTHPLGGAERDDVDDTEEARGDDAGRSEAGS